MTERKKCWPVCPTTRRPYPGGRPLPAQTLCRRICLDPFGEAAARTALLKELFGSTGTDVCGAEFPLRLRLQHPCGRGLLCQLRLHHAGLRAHHHRRRVHVRSRVSLITATHPVEAERRCWRDDIPYEGNTRAPSPSATRSGWAPGSSSIPASPSETGR